MQKNSRKRKLQPPQHQSVQPGRESQMVPKPEYENPNYKASGKLKGKTALITGGDSGIGRAIASVFAKEGCDIAIVYFNEHRDAEFTKKLVEEEGHFLTNPIIVKALKSSLLRSRHAKLRQSQAMKYSSAVKLLRIPSAV